MKFFAATFVLLLAACGQTGPLHLPDDAPEKEGYLLKKRAAKPAPAKPATPSSQKTTDAPIIEEPAPTGPPSR